MKFSAEERASLLLCGWLECRPLVRAGAFGIIRWSLSTSTGLGEG